MIMTEPGSYPPSTSTTFSLPENFDPAQLLHDTHANAYVNPSAWLSELPTQQLAQQYSTANHSVLHQCVISIKHAINKHSTQNSQQTQVLMTQQEQAELSQLYVRRDALLSIYDLLLKHFKNDHTQLFHFILLILTGRKIGTSGEPCTPFTSCDSTR
jgi:hypothetical protein